MPFVVDVSVAAAWAFPDEQGPYPNGVLGRLRQDSAIVPAIWTWELANVLLVGERRGRISTADAAAFLIDLRTLPITVDDDLPLRAATSSLSFARLLKLTVYDASYVELALRLGVPLATQDRRLIETAPRVGLALLDPAAGPGSPNRQELT